MKPTINISYDQGGLFQDFLKHLREQKLVESGQSVIVAVSGGLDSSVLAYLFAKAAKLLKITVHVAHVNHRTRGVTSQQEAEWVRTLGQRLGIEVHSLVVPEAIQLGQNEFRKHRRQLLLQLARVLKAQTIATAHHADDNAETFLMRAISGSGLSGLRGMAPKDGLWTKPLLKFTRQALEDFARENRLSWIEDPTNSQDTYLRNRIRNECFPMLDSIRAGSVQNMSVLAERLRQDESEFSAWIHLELDAFPRTMIPQGWLERWPRTFQRRIFREWLERNNFESEPQLIEALLRGEEVVHPKGVLLKHADHWIFYPESDFGSRWDKTLSVELQRRAYLGSSLAWSFLPTAPAQMKMFDLSVYLCQRIPGAKENLHFCLDWELLPKSLMLRSIRREDASEAHEMLGSVQMPKAFRRVWPVLSSHENPHEIFAIVGLGAMDRYRYQRRGPCLVFECFFEESLIT